MSMYGDKSDMINLAGFIIGNGYTDPYQDSNVWYPDTLYNFNMISPDLYSKIKTAGCIWYWDKLDIIPHVNPHVCNDYWDELNNQLNCVNIYDLFRTNYDFNCANTSTEVPQKERFSTVEIEGKTHTYRRGHTIAQRAPWLKALFREDHPAINTILGDG
jgi:hypothetical protein